MADGRNQVRLPLRGYRPGSGGQTCLRGPRQARLPRHRLKRDMRWVMPPQPDRRSRPRPRQRPPEHRQLARLRQVRCWLRVVLIRNPTGSGQWFAAPRRTPRPARVLLGRLPPPRPRPRTGQLTRPPPPLWPRHRETRHRLPMRPAAAKTPQPGRSQLRRPPPRWFRHRRPTLPQRRPRKLRPRRHPPRPPIPLSRSRAPHRWWSSAVTTRGPRGSNGRSAAPASTGMGSAGGSRSG